MNFPKIEPQIHPERAIPHIRRRLCKLLAHDWAGIACVEKRQGARI
jgi:hypothetical protein